MQRLALALAATLAAACAPTDWTLPDQGPVDFTTTEPELAAAVRDAAEDWARNGLELARFVTVNQHTDGFTITRIPRAELPTRCYYTRERAEKADPSTFDGCTMFFAASGRARGIFIADDLPAARVAAVIKHEMIHVLLPSAPHIETDVAAVFHTNGTAVNVTAADIDHLAHYSTIVHE